MSLRELAIESAVLGRPGGKCVIAVPSARTRPPRRSCSCSRDAVAERRADSASPPISGRCRDLGRCCDEEERSGAWYLVRLPLSRVVCTGTSVFPPLYASQLTTQRGGSANCLNPFSRRTSVHGKEPIFGAVHSLALRRAARRRAEPPGTRSGTSKDETVDIGPLKVRESGLTRSCTGSGLRFTS